MNEISEIEITLLSFDEIADINGDYQKLLDTLDNQKYPFLSSLCNTLQFKKQFFVAMHKLLGQQKNEGDL